MDIKFESAFDEKVFANHCEIRWKLVTEKIRRNLKSILIFATILIVLGILFFNDAPGTIFVGIVYSGYGLYKFWLFRKSKRAFNANVNKMITEFKNSNYKIDYEFTNEFIKVTDYQKEIKLNWSAFQSYSINNNVILLNQSDNFEHSHLLGEEDLTSDIFEELKIFLTENSKLKCKEV
jgi:hypothetical protein